MGSLERIMEDMSLQDCCSSLDDPASPAVKFATILTLATKYKDSDSLDSHQADTFLGSLPPALVAELLTESNSELASFQKLVYNVYATVLTLCSKEVYASHWDLVLAIFHYVQRKGATSDDISTVMLLYRPTVTVDKKIEVLYILLATLSQFLVSLGDKSLPVLDHLEITVHLMKMVIAPLPKVASGVPNQLRQVISRILHSPPQRLDDSYRKTSFEIVAELCELCNAEWLQPEPKLLCLIAHLVAAQLRIVLDDPKKIDISQLTTCLTIAETCIRSVDEDDFVDDDSGVIISKAVRDAAVFVIEYWGQAKDTEEGLPFEVECALYRFICVFLAIGGAKIAVERDLKKICPHLLRVCWVAVENKEYAMVSHLLAVLYEVPVLDNTVPQLLISFVELDESEKADSLMRACMIVDLLANRSDWYDRDSLNEAISHAKKHGYRYLATALRSV